MRADEHGHCACCNVTYCIAGENFKWMTTMIFFLFNPQEKGIFSVHLWQTTIFRVRKKYRGLFLRFFFFFRRGHLSQGLGVIHVKERHMFKSPILVYPVYFITTPPPFMGCVFHRIEIEK